MSSGEAVAPIYFRYCKGSDAFCNVHKVKYTKIIMSYSWLVFFCDIEYKKQQKYINKFYDVILGYMAE